MLLVYLQIRERFKRKINIVFLSSSKDNYKRKSSQVNPSEVGDIKAVELQSFAKFESKSHLTGSSQLEITVNYLVQVLTAISRLRSV